MLRVYQFGTFSCPEGSNDHDHNLLLFTVCIRQPWVHALLSAGCSRLFNGKRWYSVPFVLSGHWHAVFAVSYYHDHRHTNGYCRISCLGHTSPSFQLVTTITIKSHRRYITADDSQVDNFYFYLLRCLLRLVLDDTGTGTLKWAGGLEVGTVFCRRISRSHGQSKSVASRNQRGIGYSPCPEPAPTRPAALYRMPLLLWHAHGSRNCSAWYCDP
jgi:hypothetical protein